LLPEPLRGGLRPRVELRPSGIVDSHVEDAADLWRRAGFELDPWQHSGLALMTSIDAAGRWACPDYAEWVPRQNGKSVGLLTPRVLLGFLVLGEHLILWSTHLVDTTMRSFKLMNTVLRRLGQPADGRLGEFYIEFPDDGFVVKVNSTHGREGFERLDTGAEVKFVARTRGSGRGMDPELQVLDEVFALTKAQQSALAPGTAAQPNAQIVHTSTPPLDGVSGEVMYLLRKRAESDDPGALGYRDWGLAMALEELAAMPARERAAVLDDRARWAAANPSLGAGRLTEASLLRLRRALDELDFARECLGIWPTLGAPGQRLISSRSWDDRLADDESHIVGEVVFGVDANPERTAAAIGLAGRNEAGARQVELPAPAREWVEGDPWPEGLDWVVPRAVELDADHGPTVWAIDPNGPAGPLAAELEDAGLQVLRVKGPDYARACGGFYDQLPQHLPDPLLDGAVESVRRRDIGDGAFTFGRKASSANISPLVAVTLALHALVETERMGSSPPLLAEQTGGEPVDAGDLSSLSF
jgi:hypothetical protein